MVCSAKLKTMVRDVTEAQCLWFLQTEGWEHPHRSDAVSGLISRGGPRLPFIRTIWVTTA